LLIGRTPFRRLAARRGRGGRSLVRSIAGWACVMVVALVVGTAAASLGTPIPMRWRATVVRSDSMAPHLRTGDIVILSSASPDLRVGQIVRYRDPAHAGRYLLHRVTAISPDGTAIPTGGDANAEPDTTIVTRDAIEGTARWRLPTVGLPVVLLRDNLGGVAVGLTVLLVVAGLQQPR
jgi:signal peptidase